MSHFLLFYELVPIEGPAEELRDQLKPEHRELAREAAERGLLRLAGGYGDPTEGAALLFRADTRNEVEDFARRDPYVEHGLVSHWQVRDWSVVVGADA